MTHQLLRISIGLLIGATLALPLSGGANDTTANPSLDWIAGHWCAELGETTAEEIWLRPHGGIAVGLGRTRTSDRTTGFEYIRIAEQDGVQSFIAQPGGRPPTSFKRTAGGERWVRFENPDHDFPQRIEYRRDGDALHAEVAGPGDNGEETVIGFDYHPCNAEMAQR